MTYRPITDVWIMARPKYKGGKKRYGGYPAGFLERARALLGVRIDEPVLHVCGGLARFYPYRRGFGPADKTLDLDPEVQPDFLQCVTQPLPEGFAAMLADPPYSEEDAAEYSPGPLAYPNPHQLMRSMLRSLPVGHRAGLLHYLVPRNPGENAKYIACIALNYGFGNRMRAFTVFERLA